MTLSSRPAAAVALVLAGAFSVAVPGPVIASSGRTARTAYVAPDFATHVPVRTTQVVRTVRTNRWCAHVWCTKTQAWEKVDGRWRVARLPSGERAVFRSSIGPRGFAPHGKRREGDGRTPSGIFRITVTFSTGETAPGAMPWRQRLPTSVVLGRHGRLYNTWVEQPWRTDGDRPSMRWGFWVSYNHPRLVAGEGPEPLIGKGFGIFYHTSRPRHRWDPTEACTNLGRPADMRWVVRWLRPDAFPRVAQHH